MHQDQVYGRTVELPVGIGLCETLKELAQSRSDKNESWSEDLVEVLVAHLKKLVVITSKEMVSRIALQVACCDDLTNDLAVMLLGNALELGISSFILCFVQCLSVVRRFSMLENVALAVSEKLLAKEAPSREDILLLERFVFGFQHSPKLSARISELVLQKQSLLDKISGLEWTHASAIRRSVGEDPDYPVGNAKELDELRRKNSWIWNGEMKQHLPPGVNTDLSFTYPYFPWPEGCWVLSPQPGQGERPMFTLVAKERGYARSIKGEVTLFQRGARSGTNNNTPLLLEGYNVTPSSVSSAGLNRNLNQIIAAIRTPAPQSGDTGGNSSSSSSSGSGSSNNKNGSSNAVPIQFTCTKEYLHGWKGRGSEVHALLGVKRHSTADGRMIEMMGSHGIDNRLFVPKLQPLQKFQIPRSNFTFSNGFTIQVWLHRKTMASQEGVWATLMEVSPFLLRIRESNSRIEVELAGKVDGKTYLQGSCDRFIAEWLHIVLTGESSQKFSVRVHDTRINVQGNYVGPTPSVGPFKLHGPHLVCFCKIWKMAKSSEFMRNEFRSGFSYLNQNNYGADGISINQDDTLWAFIPMHGAGVTALHDVSGKNRNLQLYSKGTTQLKFACVGQMNPNARPATPNLFASADEVFVLGGMDKADDESVLLLHGNAIMWTASSFPILNGFDFKLQGQFTRGFHACIVLHGGSYWGAIDTPFLWPFEQKRQIFVDIHHQGDETNSSIFTVLVQFSKTSMVRLPSVRFPMVRENQPVYVELRYDAPEHLLSLFMLDTEVVSIKLDKTSIKEQLGMEVDGAYVGIFAPHLPLRIERWAMRGSVPSLTGNIGAPTSTLPAGTSFGDHSIYPQTAAPSVWICSVCTLHNPPSSLNCNACQTPNPNSNSQLSNDADSKTIIDLVGGEVQEEWICPKCTLVNPKGAPSCTACSEPNPNLNTTTAPAIGKKSATSALTPTVPSQTVAAAEPWACPACTFVNEPEESSCGICSGPKPVVAAPVAAVAATPSTSSGGNSTQPGLATEEQLESAIQNRIENLKHCIQGLVNQDTKPMSLDEDDEANTELYNGYWDTTVGIIDMKENAQSTEEKFVLVLEGMYGMDEGVLEVLATLTDEGVWSLFGTWDSFGKQQSNSETRVGTYSIEMTLDRSGEFLNGKWYFGDRASGVWEGRLNHDRNNFRGLGQMARLNPVVMSLKDMAERDRIERMIIPASDQQNFPYQPFATGLANMEQGLTNVCYQNSLLQSLFVTESFRRLLLFPPPTTDKTPFCLALQRLLGRMLLTQDPVLVSKELQQTLEGDWKTGQQMDVSDFNDYLMNTLSASLPENALESIFGCNTAQVLRCTNCGHAKIMHESALGLAVTLPRLYMPITDIIAVSCVKSEMDKLQIPPGFEMLRANLNKGKDDAPYVFLCVKRDPTMDPICELLVKTVSTTSPGNELDSSYTKVPISLNNSGTEEIYLYFIRDRKGSPITEIQTLIGDEEIQAPPEGFRVIQTNLNPPGTSTSSSSPPPVAAGIPTPPSSSMFPAYTPYWTTSPGSTSVANANVTNVSGSSSSDAIPVKLCYKKGMPVTDVVLSNTSPSEGTNGASYQVIDKPVNVALEADYPQEVFIWYSDSSNVFAGGPITDLVLATQEEMNDDDKFELCGPFQFIGGKFLWKRRGDGCPLTQLNVFSAPRVAPPFRFHSVVSVLSHPPTIGNLALFPWIPKIRKDGYPDDGSGNGSSSSGIGGGSGSASSSSASSSLSNSPVPKGLIARGKALKLNYIDRDVPSIIVHGKYSNLKTKNNAKSMNGRIYGIMSSAGSKHRFNGVCISDDRSMKTIMPLLMEFNHSGSELSAFVIDSTNCEDMATKVADRSEFRLSRISNEMPASKGPIVSIIVIREGDDIPPDYERVQPVEQGHMERGNINFGGTASRAAYIAVRRQVPGVEDDLEAPIVEVGLYMSELENLPSDFEQVLATPNGEDANLNYGSNGIPMYLCFKRRKKKQNAQAKVLYELRLQWKSLGEEAPSGFTPIKETVTRATEANLCMASEHTLYLCTLMQLPRATPCHHELNGTYGSTNLPLVIDLYAVTDIRRSFVVEAAVQSMFQLNSTPTSAQVSGIMIPINAGEADHGFFPLNSLLKPIKSHHWLLCGTWKNDDNQNNVAPTVWRIVPNETGPEIQAFWSWDKQSGEVHLVQDSFLQVAFAKDSSELWTDSEEVFSDRCTDNHIQSLVEHYFSSAVLDGADMPLCDHENMKTMHQQLTFLTKPPEHLVLTVKRMGYDFKKNRPIKHLETTMFEPVLYVPSAPDLTNLRSDDLLIKTKDREKHAYGLYAIIVHTGANANSGHYYAYTRHSSDRNLHEFDSKTSPWILFNDTRMNTTSWDEMTTQIENSDSGTVYLLFYRKLEYNPGVGDQHRTKQLLEHYPVKKAKTGPQVDSDVEMSVTNEEDDGHNDEDESDDFDEDDEEAILAKALRMSRESHASSMESATSKSSSSSSASAEHKRKILRRIQNYDKYMPPYLRNIISENESRLHSVERQTSIFYRNMLSHIAKKA